LIPSTVGAFISFLALVAPGIVFHLAREFRRPPYTDTTFRELSRVALTSLIFTFVSVALLVGARGLWPRMLINAQSWAAHPQRYFASHLLAVTGSIVLEVVIACLLALGAAVAMSRRSRARISPFGTWYKVLRQERPEGTRPWLTLHLTDGTELSGLLRHYSDSPILDNQEIAIGGPHMRRVTPDGKSSDIGKNFDAAVVRGEQILYMVVRYHDENGQLVRRKTKESPKGKRDIPAASTTPAASPAPVSPASPPPAPTPASPSTT
jgi:hypothetical protein